MMDRAAKLVISLLVVNAVLFTIGLYLMNYAVTWEETVFRSGFDIKTWTYIQVPFTQGYISYPYRMMGELMTLAEIPIAALIFTIFLNEGKKRPILLLGLFDFDELHGFVEVVECVHAFLCYLVGYVPSRIFRSDQSLLHHSVENLHQRLPRKVGSIHDEGRFVHALPYDS